MSSKGCEMARHSLRSLWAEHQAVQEEKEALRLRNVELERRLRRQESSTYELRANLETDLASERQSKKRLQESLDQQQQVIEELRAKLEDKDKSQDELQERLNCQEASKKWLDVQLSYNEDAYQALEAKLKESEERITKSIAAETQEAYRWAFAEQDRANAAEKQAAEEKARADAEKERADAREEEAEVEAEVNHRLFQEFMYVRDRNSRLADQREAILRSALTLRAENLGLRSRLRWTESGISRRIRNNVRSALDSDDEVRVL
ncbi:hypothetical protein PG984_009964 [Apiospora sp. TS-2023a]